MQVHMAGRQAWHLRQWVPAVLSLLCAVSVLAACTASAESVHECPDGPQGNAVAEAAGAAGSEANTPYLFQKQVLTPST